MSADKVTPITPPVTKKGPKPRFELVQPKDIVDVWRLLDQSNRLEPSNYPSIDEEDPQTIRAHLFQFMCSPSFEGAIVRIGRKAVGHVIGQIQTRPFGHPRAYLFIWSFWIEPEYRKQGLMKDLIQFVFANAKRRGVHSWEAWANDDLTEMLTKYSGHETKKLMNRIGGKIPKI